MREMTFSREEKREMLTFVRATIAARFGDVAAEPLSAMNGKMATRGSCFVTLHTSDGNLRGCIGNIIAHEALGDNLAHNAFNAAFRDPRFSPVGCGELDNLEIEISILTPPRPIAAPEEFIIGEHGIILECRGRSAVFLPQVAPEQGWNREDTLTHLCYKAGLPFRAWEAEDAKLSVFTAIVFGEKEFK
ncbi:MAG: AmmeMemoRadiSam system protein A [Victivallaceae bacterium]|nr:AmmeMemoRadiSam system protein A [Victivallaceae bacterium]